MCMLPQLQFYLLNDKSLFYLNTPEQDYQLDENFTELLFFWRSHLVANFTPVLKSDSTGRTIFFFVVVFCHFSNYGE